MSNRIEARTKLTTTADRRWDQQGEHPGPRVAITGTYAAGTYSFTVTKGTVDTIVSTTGVAGESIATIASRLETEADRLRQLDANDANYLGDVLHNASSGADNVMLHASDETRVLWSISATSAPAGVTMTTDLTETWPIALKVPMKSTKAIISLTPLNSSGARIVAATGTVPIRAINYGYATNRGGAAMELSIDASEERVTPITEGTSIRDLAHGDMLAINLGTVADAPVDLAQIRVRVTWATDVG